MDRQQHKRAPLLMAIAIGAALLVPAAAAYASAPIPNLASVSAGQSHTCAVTTGGAVQCWGLNAHGQLGIGNFTSTRVPTAVVGGTGFESVSAASGGEHTCGVKTTGSLWCWGYNNHGQLGNNGSSTIGKETPLQVMATANPVTFLANVAQVATGAEHTCALLDSGVVRCWGSNEDGQIGDGTNENRFLPRAVSGLSNITAIAAAGNHSCALTSGGGVKCWGLNLGGQLGNGTQTASNTPVDVVGLSSGVTAIALGGQHSCALLTGGGVKCWGDNPSGAIGDGSLNAALTPVAVTGLTSIRSIAAGGRETCAVTTANALSCWGSNSNGQVGNGVASSVAVKTPFAVPGGSTNVSTVTVGRAHACIRLTTGSTKCWGRNLEGQLGDNSLLDLYGPFLPDPPQAVLATRGDQSANVVWQAPASNGGSDIVRYEITTDPATVKNTVVMPATLTTSFAGLTNGTSYKFRVTAVNEQGASRSGTSNSVTPAGLPGAPTGISVTAVAGKATVFWSAAFTNGSAITAYTATSTPGGRSAIVGGTATHATITGLTSGKTYAFSVKARNGVGTGPASASVSKLIPKPKAGYLMLGANGTVYPFGDSPRLGSAVYPSWSGGVRAVAIAVRLNGTGYWVVDNQGGVRAFGASKFFGQRPRLNFGESVSTISGTPSGNGYWLFTNRGRAVPYGDARFFGDKNGQHLNGPIIASSATPTGKGYFMVASDGGVFTFGDAKFHGSTGNMRLNKPVVGLSPTPDNRGYWLVASDGGVFAFDAPFRGSMGSVRLNKPVNGLVPFGNGYLMVASDGGVFNFSDKPFFGSLGAHPPAAPIIGIAAFTA